MAADFEQAIWQKINTKTKPVGALGQLEELAAQLCRIQHSLTPTLQQPALLVFAADHGLAQEGVSAYPPEVTAQMVLNFVAGGAAINCFTQQHGIQLDVIDAGVAHAFDPSLPIKHCKVAAGTASSLQQAAMTEEQLHRCQEVATELVAEQQARGCNVLGFGEMGIGNTSSAALIMHYVTGAPLEACVGRGTGLDDAGWQRKLSVLHRVREQHGALNDPENILAAVGGFEIAMISYGMEAAAKAGMVVMVDGFIATAAALLCCQRTPESRQHMVFCHQSDEDGHALMLQHLEANALLKLNMRLGEGTGCALAYPLLVSAQTFLRDMASFDSAGVSTQAEQ